MEKPSVHKNSSYSDEFAKPWPSFTGYESPDGTTWTTVGTVSASLNTNLLAGLAVTSEYSAPLATATFPYVKVNPTVDDTSPMVSYSSGWSTTSNSSYYQGSAHSTSTAGSTVSFTFTGSSVSWIGSVGPDHGMVDVYIDGILVQSPVDTYASTRAYQQTLFSTSGLAYGTHTIQLVVRSNKNSSSTGTLVDVDAFSYS
jgi:hypothetical protein